MRHIPYGRQTISEQDIQSVVTVLRSHWIAQGPTIKKFETALARYCGAKYAVAVSSGTAALHSAYMTAGFQKDDEIITTPNTFVATTNMLLALGSKPVFCDIKPDTYGIDETKIEQLITQKTKGIVPVHFAGHPAEMDEIIRIAQKHKLTVIEDACHALGAQYKRERIGSLNTAMTIFSFHPVKPITTGEGGAIVTNNKQYYEKLLILRNHGIKKNTQGFNVMYDLGFNYRITDIQAALGVSQLKKINSLLNKRKNIARWYASALSGIKDVILPEEKEYAQSGWHLYVIRVKKKTIRNPLLRHLQKHDIGATIHYPPVYTHPYYRTHGYKNTSLSNTTEYAASCVTLPCYPLLEHEQVSYICTVIKKFFSYGKT